MGAALAAAPASSATGIQIGASGKTYASGAWQCGLHPVQGMAPFVEAGLYNPGRKAKGSVSLDGTVVAAVSASQPDATVWLNDGVDTITVATGKVADSYAFDARTSFDGQPNACIPDTRANTFSGELEYAASLKSLAVVTPGCAFNGALSTDHYVRDGGAGTCSLP
jgi:hypothetical protein